MQQPSIGVGDLDYYSQGWLGDRVLAATLGFFCMLAVYVVLWAEVLRRGVENTHLGAVVRGDV